MDISDVADETGASGEGNGAFSTIPLTSMVLYLMIIPIVAGFEQAIWLRTRVKCANVGSQIPKDMPSGRKLVCETSRAHIWGF